MSTASYEDAMGDMDIIFAGGGSAACVAAGRLAKANPDLKILLIEGGANNLNNPLVTNPALYLKHLVPDSTTALFYKSIANPDINGREAIVPAGCILGGGSSINFMMCTRAQAIDFDNWNTPGWTAEDMIPLCKKLETFHPRYEGLNMDVHGTEGPIHISDGGHPTTYSTKYLETIKAMGMEVVPDVNDFESIGSSRYFRYVSLDGKRQDAAHIFIHPLLQDGQHPNLHILVESQVIRVLFDESSPPRAIGVEYKTNARYQPSVTLSKVIHKTVKAKKLVVVSAGALGSPQILERSGIGNPEILKKLDIPVVSDVPGVGENYQDHHLVFYPYKTTLDASETLDGVWSGRPDFDFAKLAATKDSILGYNAIDVAGKLRMTPEEVDSLGPEFAEDYNRDFLPYPTRPVMLTVQVNAFLADPSLVEPGQYVTLCTYTAYPYARGSIHITSATDCSYGYEFDNGFLKNQSDVKKLLWAYKKIREIGRRLPYIESEVPLGHPSFAADSQAAKFTTGKPGELKDIVYTSEDDAVIVDHIRNNVNTTWHSLGTCAMKKREEGGVVDADLNVYGTMGLKVADLSIPPENVAANTNNTALAIGEKAAVIIGKELGIKV